MLVGLCGIAFLIIVTFVAVTNIIFDINTLLDPKVDNKINVNKIKLILLKPFLLSKAKKGVSISVFKLIWILVIITYVIYISFTTSYILLCISYASGVRNKIVSTFFIISLIVTFVFACTLAIILETKRKRKKKDIDKIDKLC